MAGWELGDLAGVEGALALGVMSDAFAVGVGGEELVGFAVGGECAVVFPEGEGDGFEGVGLADAGEDELGLEEGEEAVGGVLALAGAGLGEVLEDGEDVQVLPARVPVPAPADGARISAPDPGFSLWSGIYYSDQSPRLGTKLGQSSRPARAPRARKPR